MSTRSDRALTPTAHGQVCCARVQGAAAYRVGFPPTAWEWVPWEFATDGRFSGRWDDPAGVWRTLYAGATALTCYLEVLAFARPSAEMIDAMSEIVDDDEFPTIAPGRLPRSWAHGRVAASGAVSGWFARPGDVESLATLRAQFRGTAFRYGLEDLDGAAIRDGRPRQLTQAISQWINTLPSPDGVDLMAGIQFDSRHGDAMTLWAIYERPADTAISSRITPLTSTPVDPDDPELVEAMRLLHLVWADN